MLQLLSKLCLTQISISIGLIQSILIMRVFCCSEVKLLPPELKTSALLFFFFFNLEFPELFPHLSLQESELLLFRLSLQKTLFFVRSPQKILNSHSLYTKWRSKGHKKASAKRPKVSSETVNSRNQPAATPNCLCSLKP